VDQCPTVPGVPPSGCPQTGLTTITNQYVQYRTYAPPATDKFQGWVALSRGGVPAPRDDIQSIALLLEGGTSPTPVPIQWSASNYDGSQYYKVDWDGVQFGTYALRGDEGFRILPTDPLAAGTYHYRVQTFSGESFDGPPMSYGGMIQLPYATWPAQPYVWNADGSLTISWVNPVNDQSWPLVSELRVQLSKGSGGTVLDVRVTDTTVTSVTLPAELVAGVASLGVGPDATCQVQTRSANAGNMNDARGFSAPWTIPWTPAWMLTAGRYVQYRTFENTSNDKYRGWVDIRKDGAPITSTDVAAGDIVLKDGSGQTVATTGAAFHASRFYNFTWDPSLSIYVLSGPMNSSGYSLDFDDVPAGQYTFELATSGGPVTAGVSYPGLLALPAIASSSMTVTPNTDGGVRLAWQDPGDVDVVLELDDDNGEALFYAFAGQMPGPGPVAREFWLPPNVVQSVKDLNPSLTTWSWRVQTRAAASGPELEALGMKGMNYARGLSDAVAVSVPQTPPPGPTPTPLTLPASVPGSLLAPENDAWYWLTAAAGDQINASVSWTSGAGSDLDLELVDGTNPASPNVIAWSGLAAIPFKPVQAVAANTGTYLVHVHRVNDVASFLLSVSVTSQMTDTDQDGLTATQESTYGTDPNKPDTDGDLVGDGLEVLLGTVPTAADTHQAFDASKLEGTWQQSDPSGGVRTVAITWDGTGGTYAMDYVPVPTQGATEHEEGNWTALDNGIETTVTVSSGGGDPAGTIRAHPVVFLDAGYTQAVFDLRGLMTLSPP
jgi:hypothetical protein